MKNRIECMLRLLRHSCVMKNRLSAVFLTLLLFSSCTQRQQQGAAVGGVAGGLLGALAGKNDGSAARGALIGAAAGTAIASIQEENARKNQAYHDERSYQNPPVRNAPAKQYPYAEATSISGVVLSPYEPYNEIDVRGLRSGTLAKDPSCGKIFRIP